MTEPGADPGPGGSSDSPDEAEPGKELRARLDAVRDRISEVDDALIRLIGERRALVLEAGSLKEALGLPVLDPSREAAVVRKAAERARKSGVDEEMTRDVLWRIISSARQAQEGRPGLPPSPVENAPATPDAPFPGDEPPGPDESTVRDEGGGAG